MEISSYDILFSLVNKYSYTLTIGKAKELTHIMDPDDTHPTCSCFAEYIFDTNVFFQILDDMDEGLHEDVYDKHNIRFIYISESIDIYLLKDKKLIWK